MSETPKWRERWDELVGDHKYLAIKGWDDFQEEYTYEWCKDYFGKDEDPDYNQRPKLECWIMDWLRRQRGRMRQNLYSDPVGLLDRMNMSHAADYSVAPRYLVRLVEVGFLIPTNEQDRKSKRVYKGSKGKGKIEVEEAEAVPVPPVPQKQLEPAASDSTCGCGYAEENGKPCPYCANSGVSAPANDKPQPAPRRPTQLGFDPYSIAPFDDWTADDIRLVACYWWEHAKDTWYRENVNTTEFFQKKFPDMAGRLPKGWQPPKKATAPKQADPVCPRCHGSGEYKVDKPGYPKGMFFQRVICGCTTEASISPVQT